LSKEKALVEDLLQPLDAPVEIPALLLAGLETRSSELRQVLMDGVQERLDAVVELSRQRARPLSEGEGVGLGLVEARHLGDQPLHLAKELAFPFASMKRSSASGPID
jgi:hypothetical protein